MHVSNVFCELTNIFFLFFKMSNCCLEALILKQIQIRNLRVHNPFIKIPTKIQKWSSWCEETFHLLRKAASSQQHTTWRINKQRKEMTPFRLNLRRRRRWSDENELAANNNELKLRASSHAQDTDDEFAQLSPAANKPPTKHLSIMSDSQSTVTNVDSHNTLH